MEQLNTILDSLYKKQITPQEAKGLISELLCLEQKEVQSDEPILVGHLNKVFGYNEFKKLEIGTEVFLQNNLLYFEMIPESGSKTVKQKFTIETLTPCINKV